MPSLNSISAKKILIICPFPTDSAAGQRLKYEQYFGSWKEAGYEITVSSFMDESMWSIVYLKGRYLDKVLGTIRGYFRRIHDLFRISKYDVIYIFHWATPFGSVLYERTVRSLSKRLIYDIEDSISKVDINEVNSITASLKNINKHNFLMKVADYVITSSPSLNNYCLNVNDRKKCKYISSSVDVNRFLPINTYNNTKKVTIGWTGTFSSIKYLELLRGVFKELRKICDFKLFIIGNFEYKFPEMDLEVVQWSKEREVEYMQRIDIGIYPLSDTPWVHGKSGLKAIQYMAFGLPTVATNVGTTPKIIEHMENGWLVDSDKEWVKALETLIKDFELRKKLGQAARRTIVNRYSTGVIKTEYLSIINEFFRK
jgi:glycosyltransferase involved in cell wall biosynthesis